MQEVMGIEQKHAPVHFFARTFLGDLDSVGCPSGDRAMAIVLRLQQACTRTAIRERSFADLAINPSKDIDLRHRLDGIWSYMEAAKSLSDTYLQLPVEDYPIFPFGIFAHFTYVVAVLFRVSSMEPDGWDVKLLWEFAGFSVLMEQASARYDKVSQTCPDGLILNNDAFTKWSAKTIWAKSFYDTKLRSSAMGNLDLNRPGPGSRSNNTAPLGERPCLISPAQVLGSHVDFLMLLGNSGILLDPTSTFGDPIWNAFNEPFGFTGDLHLAMGSA
ncbi:trna processing endoribonuclease protein [Stemphylium lycopersici]|uniref:Trna processing endoribonuclease protein n=1 Tax=Stemphylium lycopersici TaxID=183478 RepID=A0A364ND31_STELY|nr:trna processing endoribonuclease protein [Stemphylium lycopersici]RAR10396.1 trna processing endoribonuclease protein [Stemphylium lycopersici]RAR15235.1 trna processing endoribonuclease protein [Stemphylium lycopersici]